jgi:hypothetical protein
MVENEVGQFLAPLTRGVYTLSMFLAAASLVLAATSARTAQSFRRARFVSVLAAAFVGLSMFLMADYTFLVLLPSATIGLPWVLWWLVPLSIWYAYGFRRDPAHRERWKRIRAVLIALCFPVVVFNLVQMGIAIAAGYFGLPVYYFGVHLVTLGYLKLAAQARAGVVGEQVLHIQLEEVSAKSAATRP